MNVDHSKAIFKLIQIFYLTIGIGIMGSRTWTFAEPFTIFRLMTILKDAPLLDHRHGTGALSTPKAG